MIGTSTKAGRGPRERRPLPGRRVLLVGTGWDGFWSLVSAVVSALMGAALGPDTGDYGERPVSPRPHASARRETWASQEALVFLPQK